MTTSPYILAAIACGLLAAPAPAMAQVHERLCAPIAAALLAGKADQTDPVYDSLAEVLAPDALPAGRVDFRTAFLGTHPSAALTAAVTRMIGQYPAENLATDLVFKWLDPGRAGAIEFERGHMDCASLLFFRVADGRADIAQPRHLTSDAMNCASRKPALSLINGTPSLMLVEGSRLADMSGRETVTVMPWAGMEWGKPCTVSVRFAKPRGRVDDGSPMRTRGKVLSVKVE